MPKVLNIPDAHVEHGQNLERFDKAGNVIVSERPDVVVVGGDFSSMKSISHWDQNKRITMEGKRYHLDAKTCKEALTRLLTPLWELQAKQRETKSKVYKPTLLYLEGNHECVEENTEILTTEGWVPAKDITKDHQVASFDKDHYITYNRPIAVAKDYNRNLVSVAGDMSDELVSDNHNLYVDGKLIKVDQLLNTRIRQNRFTYAGNLSGCPIAADTKWCQLLTWVVMDGTIVRSDATKKKTRIQFKLSKPRKIDKLQELLRELKIPYTFRPCKKYGINKLQPYYIRIYGEDARTIYDALGGKKEIPSYFKYFHKDAADSVIKTILDTDGHRDWAKINWCTTSKRDADTIQLMCIFNGIPCKITPIDNRSGFANGKQQYVVTILDKGASPLRSVEIKPHPEKATVVAIQTKDRTLVTRRNGKVAFTGNCWIHKYVEDNPSMEGHIDLRKDLALDSFGFRIVPYREYVDIGGVLFTHVPIDGSKQAIKGADITKVAARYVGKPCVFFHTHRFECSSVSRVGQPDMQMMTCGCFFEEETDEFGIHLWRGLVIANIYAPGKYDVEQISMERLYRDW